MVSTAKRIRATRATLSYLPERPRAYLVLGLSDLSYLPPVSYKDSRSFISPLSLLFKCLKCLRSLKDSNSRGLEPSYLSSYLSHLGGVA